MLKFKFKTKMLTNDERLRVVELYMKYDLENKRSKFEKLSDYALEENIQISSRRARDLILKWKETGSVRTKYNMSGAIARTKITVGDMFRLENLLYKKRQVTSAMIKSELNLEASTRTIRKYIKLLDWRSVSIIL